MEKNLHRLIKKNLIYAIKYSILVLISYTAISTVHAKYNSSESIDKTDYHALPSIRSTDIVRSIGSISRSGKYPQRKKSSITDIAIHHSATNKETSAEDIALIGISRFGKGHSYHYQIDYTGKIQQTNWLESISPHVGDGTTKNNNTRSIGIVLIGNYETDTMTIAMKTSTMQLVKYLKNASTLPNLKNISGHCDYKATKCPGRNVIPFIENVLRKEFDNE